MLSVFPEMETEDADKSKPSMKPTNDLLDSKEYLDILAQVSGYFKNKSRLDSSTSEDLYQDLYLSFKEKQMAIVIAHYNAEVGNFSGYFRRAAYNKCRELLRSKRITDNRTDPIDKDDFIHQVINKSDDPESKTIANELVQQEFYKLDMFINLLSKQPRRLRLLLKLYTRIILKKADLKHYHPNITKTLINQALLLFGINYLHLQDKQVMEYIFPVIQNREPEVNQVSSLRRWFDRQINKLIDYLNAPGQWTYNNSALRNILSLYFKVTLKSQE